MPVEVPYQGANLQAHHLLALDGLDQPFVDVELLSPLFLLLHDCPCGGELVVVDDHALGRFLLQVNRPANLDAVDLSEEALFLEPPRCLTPLHYNVEGRAKQSPQHIACVLLDLVVVFFPHPANLRGRHDLSNAVLRVPLAVIFPLCEGHQRLWYTVNVRDFHYISKRFV